MAEHLRYIRPQPRPWRPVLRGLALAAGLAALYADGPEPGVLWFVGAVLIVGAVTCGRR